MHKYKSQNFIIRLFSIATCCLVIFSSLFFVATAKAQTNNSGQALEIAPPVVYVNDAEPGQTIKRQLYLRDVSKTDLIVTGEANDFTAAGENGTPKLILDEEPANNPYSLKDWIDTPQELRLVPREVKTMNITIRVPDDASPGGHYGIIRFTATPPNLKDSGVALSTSLGALILLTVKGDVKENLSIKEFSVNKDGKKSTLFESAPLTFSERIENTGNIHEQPSGIITIKDMFGRVAATLGINQPPRNILPQSTRKFDQNLDKAVIGNKKLFGRYTAELVVTYGVNKTKVSSSTTFWVIPYKLIAAIILLLIVGFFALRFAMRRYNDYILGRARGGSRRKK